MEVNNRYITITKHIQGSAKESDFELKVAPLGLSVEPGSNDIIVKNLCVSIDPYQLNRMKSYSSSQKTAQAAVGISPGQVRTSIYNGFRMNILVGDYSDGAVSYFFLLASLLMLLE
jgi:NADPH-dependent curcumin reductase CurA